MLCPRCQRSVDPAAAFCGNCGFQLAVQTEQYQPPQPTQQTPAYQEAVLAARPVPPPVDHSGKAIASLILGVLGIPACLIPVVGIIFGILAIVFGTLSFHSRRRLFAVIGMSLATIVLLVSIFMWVQNTQEILENKRTGKVVPSSNQGRDLQAISTPCFTTKIPVELSITKTDGSCTFLGNNVATGEQEQVKILQVPGLTLATLATAAKADAANVVNTIPGGSITKQGSTTFAGSQAYAVEIKATDGSAGLITYVYNTTAQGNLAIILHTQARASGTNYDLSSIESNWSWL